MVGPAGERLGRSKEMRTSHRKRKSPRPKDRCSLFRARAPPHAMQQAPIKFLSPARCFLANAQNCFLRSVEGVYDLLVWIRSNDVKGVRSHAVCSLSLRLVIFREKSRCAGRQGLGKGCELPWAEGRALLPLASVPGEIVQVSSEATGLKRCLYKS